MGRRESASLPSLVPSLNLPTSVAPLEGAFSSRATPVTFATPSSYFPLLRIIFHSSRTALSCLSLRAPCRITRALLMLTFVLNSTTSYSTHFDLTPQFPILVTFSSSCLPSTDVNRSNQQRICCALSSPTSTCSRSLSAYSSVAAPNPTSNPYSKDGVTSQTSFSVMSRTISFRVTPTAPRFVWSSLRRRGCISPRWMADNRRQQEAGRTIGTPFHIRRKLLGFPASFRSGAGGTNARVITGVPLLLFCSYRCLTARWSRCTLRGL